MTAPAPYHFERCEKKYFLTSDQQEALLKRMQPYMQADRYGRYSIGNIYYDTPNWQLIRASIEKPAYKEKLRVRCYGVPTENSPVFVELKKKCAGVVFKRRITTELCRAAPFLQGGAAQPDWGQTGREIEWFQQFYHTVPKMFIGYDRTAYAGREDPSLRITFDTAIRWRKTELELSRGGWGRLLLPPDQVLMELKLTRACPLWLCRLLSELALYPTSFSKYGACYRQMMLTADPDPLTKEAHFCA